MRPDRRVLSLRALGALAALVGSLAAASPVSAWCRMTTSQTPALPGACPTGLPLEWRKPCSRYHLFDPGSRSLPLATVREIFTLSFSQWESIECGGSTIPGMPNLEAHLSTDASQCGRSEYVTAGANVSTVVFADDWTERGYDPSAYAVTTVWHSTRTGEIYDVDMEINEDGRTYADCPSPDGCTNGDVDLQNVITHEAGHYFGLAHTNVMTATMYASSPPGEILKRILKADDIEGFCNVYPPGHFDGVACDDTPRGGATLTCKAVDDGCGCSVPGSGPSQPPLGVAGLAALLVVSARSWRGRATAHRATARRAPRAP